MKVKSMIADTPSHRALFGRSSTLIRLAFDAKVHDVVSANGAVVYYNIPSP